MGALHQGHLSLIKNARRKVGGKGRVVVSIFVNPMQFGPGEDYSRYPRCLAKDSAACRAVGTDVLFLPSVEDVYPAAPTAFIDESDLARPLCGQSRPGHFRGVCTVVGKLFNMVQPDCAVFGEKDWQQLAVIRRMVRDLDFPVTVYGAPILREADGLAMSSRNENLTAEERSVAPRIFETLQAAVEGGGSARQIRGRALRRLKRLPGAQVDYVEAVDAESLEPLRDRLRPGRLAVAVFFSQTRLIDNIAIPKDD